MTKISNQSSAQRRWRSDEDRMAQASAMNEKQIPSIVLVVEDDPASKAAVLKVLSDMGAGNIETAETSEAAWAALRVQDFDLILLDWKLSPASGAAILHRIRATRKCQDVPVLVVSGVITKADFVFGEEYLFTALLEKPFDATSMSKSVKNLMNEQAWWKTQCEVLERLASGVSDKIPASVETLLAELKDAPRFAPVGYAAARNLVAKGQLVSAVKVLEKVLEKDDKSALALTLRGKICLLQNDFAAAKKYLLSAHALFPQNSERLTLIGDSHMNLLEFQKAAAAFNEAAAIDTRNTRAKVGEALALDTERFFAQLDISTTPTSLPSLLNAIGVGLVKDKRFDEGISYYQNALNYLQSDMTKSRVAFNLGLGYLKAHKPTDALSWFKASEKLSGGSFAKAHDYVTKLEATGVHAEAFPLSTGSDAPSRAPTEGDESPEWVRMGDNGSHDGQSSLGAAEEDAVAIEVDDTLEKKTA